MRFNLDTYENFREEVNAFKKSLTPEEIIEIVKTLGADRYEEREDYIVFPTICHNLDSQDASMKLYYYKDTQIFHCYTECSESFDIYRLVEKVYALRDQEMGFFECYLFLRDNSTKKSLIRKNNYINIDKYRQKETTIEEIPELDKNLLNLFSEYYYEGWINEGITIEAMKKYNIRLSIAQNKIIIPHYDIKNRLIGIRGRALDEREAEYFGKYMPIRVEEQYLAHPLSLNLYGINFNAQDIKDSKTAILFEGEKSCLKFESYFGYNNSVAVCGSSININQINILRKLGVREVIIAFDREYTFAASQEGEKYFQKLYNMCKKYTNLINMSFIYDYGNILKEKDSPIDEGRENFLELLNKRIQVQ